MCLLILNKMRRSDCQTQTMIHCRCLINLTASCVNVSLEDVEAFDRTVAQVTRHVSSFFSSEHTALVRLHLIMTETESAREGYYWHRAHVVWCLPKMESYTVEVLSTFFTVTNHSILFLLDRHQTACTRCQYKNAHLLNQTDYC